MRLPLQERHLPRMYVDYIPVCLAKARASIRICCRIPMCIQVKEHTIISLQPHAEERIQAFQAKSMMFDANSIG